MRTFIIWNFREEVCSPCSRDAGRLSAPRSGQFFSFALILPKCVPLAWSQLPCILLWGTLTYLPPLGSSVISQRGLYWSPQLKSPSFIPWTHCCACYCIVMYCFIKKILFVLPALEWSSMSVGSISIHSPCHSHGLADHLSQSRCSYNTWIY